MRLMEDLVLTYVCNSLWQAPLALGGGWLVARLCARLGARAQYRAWTISLLTALLLPAVGGSVAGLKFHAGAADARVMLPAAGAPPTTPRTAQTGAIALPAGVANGLLVLYGMLLLAAVSRFVFGVLRTRRLIRESRKAVLGTEDAELWARCRAAFSVGTVEIRVHPGLAGPVTCGWRQQWLILPEDFFATSEGDDLLAGFAHEAAHSERRDFFWNGVLMFVTLPVAYHPAAWFLQSRIAESRELLCDHLAATRVLNAERYATSLFRLVSRISREQAATSIHVIGIFDANILEKRMKTLSEKVPSIGRPAVLARVAGSIVLAGGVLFIGASLAVGVTQAAATDSTVTPR